MKELLQKVHPELKTLGYKKKANNFWKVENGIYRLINFQKGLYGGYYFINIGLHPFGMPQLIPDQLMIIEHPKEYDCIIRRRVDHIVESEEVTPFKKGLVSIDDDEVIRGLIKILPEIEKWMIKYGSFIELASRNEKEIKNLLNIAPGLEKKAIYFIKLYCEIKQNNKGNAITAFDKYKSEFLEDLNFKELDEYLYSLIEKFNN
jgi:hypothetical protein